MVKAWRELITIPTYEVGKAEKNPMFLEKRVYQGSSGVVYPYPVIEKIADEKVDREYLAVWLENEYIKVMILPELGGRVQMAFDKIRQRHFVYYNHVIKPALVGLTGPWISGGIEFNWPQHHRPSTFLPVDHIIEEGEDGSATVWCNEMERMFHQKALVGFTLHPGCAYLEIHGRLSNRTSLPQTFLWWANPAVEVNDAYQSVFPPDVNAVFDHGKRAVSSFPIATGTYYKMDYSAGVDISNYRNIKVPTSYMAVNSKYDFEGGYENDTQAGMLHVASHHFSSGKKQWTWGNGDFGRAWDRNLTDCVENEEWEKGKGKSAAHDGQQEDIIHCPLSIEKLRPGFRPYIELMAGVYTENQPDFTWLMPYEEKQFTQYFMPYRELGVVKQATKDFVFNIEDIRVEENKGIGDLENKEIRGGKIEGNRVRFKVMATSKQRVQLVLTAHGEDYYNKVVTLSPEEVLTEVVDVKDALLNDLTFYICREQPALVDRDKKWTYKGVPLLTWHAEPDEVRPIPDSAEAALPPVECKTCDQLYLTGLHLEQYRHATWSALDYYEEALRRDPDDVRCLNQIGLWYLRRGRFQKAEEYLRRAMKIWQRRNPNPYDGEPIFNLALSLKFQLRKQEAYELFWKASWNKAWADASFFEAACISLSECRLEDALDEVNRCLISNSHNHKARGLKTVILRQLGRKEEALAWIRESLVIDPFNYVCLYEKYLLTEDEEALKRIVELMHENIHNFHELALDYAQAGLWQECIDILRMCKTKHPLTYYYMGWAQLGQGDAVAANDLFEQAEKIDSYCCFPNRLEDVVVLNMAKTLNPDGARAPYYLGCLYYDKRQYDLAIENWELSARLDPQFPTVWRNLALARFNKQGRQAEAVEYMERAFHLDENDERVLMELDQLYKRLQRPHAERLAFLQQYPELILRRDDLVLEEVTLLNQVGCYKEAMRKLDAHQFHPWEGGEGKVPAQYQICRVEQAKHLLSESSDDAEGAARIQLAIRLLKECLVYPHHLGEGKLYGAQENDFHYLLGIAYERQGQFEKARSHYRLATEGPTEPAAAMYYNDAKPDKIFYAALAYRKLASLAAKQGEHGEGPKTDSELTAAKWADTQWLDGKANSICYKLINYGQQHLFHKVTMDYFAVSLPDLLIWDNDLQLQNTIHCNLIMALGHIGLGHTEKGLQFLAEVERLNVNHPVPAALRSLLRLL